MMTKKSIRITFIILIIYLPVQYILVAVSGLLYEAEPWPALVFPGFKNVFVFNDHFVLNQAYFEIQGDEGETVQLKPMYLFPDMPLSKINGFMRSVFPDQNHVNSFNQSTITWLYQRAGEVTELRVVSMEVVRMREFASLYNEKIRVDSTHVDQRIQIPEVLSD